MIPDLKDRMTPDLDAMIHEAGAILVGNFYRDTLDTLEAAAKDRPVLDLTRMNRQKVSSGTYEGICW